MCGDFRWPIAAKPVKMETSDPRIEFYGQDEPTDAMRLRSIEADIATLRQNLVDALDRAKPWVPVKTHETTVAALEAELAKERNRRFRTDLAFVLSDAILPTGFEPTLPPTIRLHRFIERQKKQIQTLREALQVLVDQGEPLRGDGELWTSWQVRVKERLAAIKTLTQTEE
jgi:hypothetical protein